MQENSQGIRSRQDAIHENLDAVVKRHLAHSFRKPIAHPTQVAFETVEKKIARSTLPLVLDSGCGTGMSTIQLAQSHPNHLVLGIDKSAHRLAKAPEAGGSLENLLFVRADLIDFWRLAVRAEWRVARHFLLYPNPWPLKSHLKRRFHAHPVFPDLIKLGDVFVLRSNWKVYLEEFARAFEVATGICSRIREIHVASYMTLFEKKYALSGQEIFELVIR